MASLLLSLAALIEGATGIALIISPQVVSRLLLGADLAVAGIAVGRVAGIALLSLGLGCWLSRRDFKKTSALAAMLSYNLLVTTYLTYLGLGGELIGALLWPAIALHSVMTLLFAYVRFNNRQPKQAHPG